MVVVNASGARFNEGDPIMMTADDVAALAAHAPGAQVVAVHLEAINHCPETRADLRQRLHADGLSSASPSRRTARWCPSRADAALVAGAGGVGVAARGVGNGMGLYGGGCRSR